MIFQRLRLYPVFIALFLLFSSNSQAQVQTPRYISITPNTNGFYEYLPQSYNPASSETYPLLIFIHGLGELGNGNSYELPRVLANGPPKLINQGSFPVSFTVNSQTYKFIVISPQFIAWPTALDINTIINYVNQNYRVNINKIYVTGLSMGGGATWEYAGNQSLYARRLAALLPVCGASWPDYGRARTISTSNLPVWATHNSGDPTVPVVYTNDYVTQINQAPAPNPLAKKTIFNVGGHDAWSTTYNPAYKENGLNVYEWMLQYQRNFGTVNEIPIPDAGPDVNMSLPTNSVQLNAGNSWDLDGNIVSYNWTKISGPVQFTFNNSNIVNPFLSNLLEGNYVFQLKITDNQGGIATDNINIRVNGVQNIPGKVEAENYSAMFGVNTENTGDAGGGLNVGYIDTGDWMDYNVNVAASGTYTVNFRIAAPSAGGQLQLRKSDGTVLNTVTIPQTGGWQTWATISSTANLSAGNQVLRIICTGSVQWNINWFEFVSSTPGPNQPPVANAGPNQTIVLPASTVTLSGSGTDPDGTITAYGWIKVSGPNATIASPSSANTNVTGLVAGTYVFRLTVTDNLNATATSDVTITVNTSSSSPNRYFRAITIDRTKVANTTQYNFPVLISGTYPFLKTTANGGKVYNANGFDVTFTADIDGTVNLNWEIEKYNPATGEIVAWVKIDALSPTADKVIYMYYSDPAINSFQGNVTGTWNSAYASVYHLANGTTLSAADATSNTNNGTITGATARIGQMDGAANLSGTPQYINIGTGALVGITGNMTIEAWVNPTDYSNFNGILSKTAGNQPKPYDFYLVQGSGIPVLFRGNGTGANSNVNATTAPPTGVWSHIVVTTSGSTVNHYLNGVPNGSGNLGPAGTPANGTDIAYIGTRSDLATRFKGGIDEVRISNGNLSADWIKTEFNNQSSPATFYNLGIEQIANTQNIVSNSIIVNKEILFSDAPLARAGDDQTITLPELNSVYLNGSASKDKHKIIAYQWKKITGTGGTFTTPASPATNFTNLNEGIYVIELQIINDANIIGRDTVKITVGNIVKSASSILIFPNPVTNQFVLTVDPGLSGKMEINIFDLKGNLVKKLYLSKSIGVRQFNVNVSDLKAGTYIIKTNIGTWKGAVKMIKM